MHSIPRRHCIELAFKCTTIVALGSMHCALKAGSSEPDNTIGLAELTRALRAMDNDVCSTAAEDLDTAHATNAPLHLHLRSAGLKPADAQTLAKALSNHSMASKHPLRSFSVSFNPGLGDSGVEILAKSLPLDLHEIGFVGCRIGDKGCDAIVQWAARASELKIICIEGNNLKKAAVSRLNALKQNNPKLSVYS